MKNLNSIKLINNILFLLIIYFNIFSYFLTEASTFKIFYLSTTLVFICLFFAFNFLYNKEDFFQREILKKIAGEYYENQEEANSFLKKLLYKKLKYVENKENYKLFRNIYIRNNLVKKDYNDLKTVFSKFIPDGFIDEIGAKGTDKISLGISVKKHLHIMFLDIIGFSGISEKLPPERVLLLLNIYFDGIVEIVKSNGGYVDKFLGDGIMIIFNGGNSDSCINSAIEIQKFIKKFNFSEIGKQINVGVGINSGEVILGTIGSKDRMEITVIGDTVNIAARLEHITRTVESYTIISESTYKNLSNKENLIISDLGYKEIKGKKKKIKIYGIEEKNKNT